VMTHSRILSAVSEQRDSFVQGASPGTKFPQPAKPILSDEERGSRRNQLEIGIRVEIES